MLKYFIQIHRSDTACRVTPRLFTQFIKTYRQVYSSKLDIIGKQRSRLGAGLKKIEDGMSSINSSTRTAKSASSMTSSDIFSSPSLHFCLSSHLVPFVAAKLVDELKAKAREQRTLLQQKQLEADQALQDITTSMQRASTQKAEVERVKENLCALLCFDMPVPLSNLCLCFVCTFPLFCS
jgi:hypothetical protein